MTDPAVSLVVVCHEMARELPRTIRSLTAPYQNRRVPGEREIIIVDNGSACPPTAEQFAALDAEPRILCLPDATVSPVAAVNAGLAAARGSLIGVWIDGARLASPGLVDACLAAAALHPRPVIATLNYQLGPALQFDSARRGYDQAAEDRLLASIGWPTDGYRLFDVAVSELRGGPAGPILESNALFLPRALWDELGGYDPAFIEPGGGLGNADAFLRACALPDVQLIRILGEGTFHQFHGGLSTSAPERAMQTLQQGTRAYLRRRGRPPNPLRTQGWLFDARASRVIDRP
ncbi:glycosyltransferase [Rhodopila sp.]|uniref:glycosyltransferase n=1 Tax=Rhodopila sp. TaxID=2480087 RepID=UPI002D155182|nr:glycosyltransferase [Rhodopila sp.]HVZ10029.1 glycosyltransferase [Rhodopila sp.]